MPSLQWTLLNMCDILPLPPLANLCLFILHFMFKLQILKMPEIDSLFYLKVSIKAYQSSCPSVLRVNESVMVRKNVAILWGAGNHLAAKCQRTCNTPPTCCNLDSPQTANYFGSQFVRFMKTTWKPVTKPTQIPIFHNLIITTKTSA